MDLAQLIPSGDLWLAWAVKGFIVSGVIGIVVAIVAPLLAGIPFVGPILAGIFSAVAMSYQEYLRTLPARADEAVQAVEALAAAELKAAHAAGVAVQPKAASKKTTAVELVKASVPASIRPKVDAAVESAVTRLKASGGEQRADELLAQLVAAQQTTTGPTGGAAVMP